MVKVREDYLLDDVGEVDLAQWAHDILDKAGLESDNTGLLIKAADTARQVKVSKPQDDRWSNSACSFLTGLEMADILADLQVDLEALIAATLYRSVREGKLPISHVNQYFGDKVSALINGVLRMAAISRLRNDSEHDVFGQQSVEQTDNVRKMLVSMIDDVRVALIKLTERTCAIRAVKDSDESNKRKVAKEVADIYAPLAHRLGIGHIKWELEDLSFRYLKPDAYKNIAQLLAEKRLDREHYIVKMIESIHTQLNKNDIQGDISGRAKHIYSIWKKMQRKNINFSEVYDIRAVRVLVPTTKDCYEVLGIVHTLWRNIPHEFDDYIAAPKENGYRSLHTAVIGPEQKVIEVQIRSQIMHEEAEFGVCAHWRYKMGNSQTVVDSYEQKLAWLRNVLEWHDDIDAVEPLADDLRLGLTNDRVYVFTRDGHVVDLPQQATPLDFAYRIHTEIGHSCRGAKVNNRIVPLNYALKTSDQVEILTGNQEAPSRDWLIEGLGYLATGKARAKVKQWFSEQARDKNISDGRYLLEKELKRLALPLVNQDLLGQLALTSMDNLYVAIGTGELGVGHVVNIVQKRLSEKSGDADELPFFNKRSRLSPQKIDQSMSIDGVGNLLTTIARCCSPIPGDEIAGFITLGRGVSVHRQDCNNLLQLQIDEPERIIKVDWSHQTQRDFNIDIYLEAFDRHGLLKDIAVVLDGDHINISDLRVVPNLRNMVEMHLTIDVRDLSQLSRALVRLSQLPNISFVERRHS
ncbi:GTP diphosphokinase [bacterium]|nr:GTP diphosphokinase [bacterium]